MPSKCGQQRNCGSGERFLQRAASARDDQIDRLGVTLENLNRIAIGSVDEGHRGRIDSRFLEGAREHLREDGVGRERFLSAAQHHRAAALEGQHARIDRHIGPRFVDDRDDAEWHAHFLNLQTVGAAPALDHFANRIRKRRNFLDAFGHRGDARIVEREAFQERARPARVLRDFEIFAISFEDRRRHWL